MKLKTLAIMSVAFLMIGCASPYAPMSKKVQEKIQVLDASLIIKQSNIDVTVSSSDTGQGGIIGSLILAGVDAVRRSNAKDNATPIIAALENYDFRSVMYKATNNSLGKLNKFKGNRPITLDKVGSETVKKITLNTSKANALLFCSIYYQLQSGNLMVTLDAQMYPKSNTLKAFRKDADDADILANGNRIYVNQFVFVKQGITADNVVSGLNEAAKSLASQVVQDLNHGI